MESNLAEKRAELRILAFVAAGMQERIRRQLAPLDVTIDFISKVAELSQLTLRQTLYPVALLPAVLPDNSWWVLWGEIALLEPHPEILVYAHSASFQLWAGVLELGGYDVIVEPFTDEELQCAVLCAAKSFEERRFDNSGIE